MKKVIKSILIFSSLLFLSSCVIPKTSAAPEPIKTITVSGSGTVSLSPDLVSISFVVRTTDWNVSKAAETNAVNTSNVIKALQDNGVDVTDISTYDYRITQDNSNNYPGKYTVINTISVLVRNVKDTGKLIDVAVKDKIGANGVTNFEYLVSDKTSALRQARTLAVQNAQDAAALLAGASGCKVGEVMNMREDYTSTSRNSNLLRTKAMAADYVQTPIETGTVEITSNISITYSLLN